MFSRKEKISSKKMPGNSMRHLIFIVLMAAILSTSGCTGENKIANATANPTPINLHKTVDVSTLQAKYGIYGSCSDVSRISLEISQTDAIYRCSDPKKSIQFDNPNCFYHDFYIDSQARYDIASLSTEVCAREEAGRH
jgi:hypothetical protein